MSYNLTEFEKIGKCDLPEPVLSSIRALCRLVGYVEKTPNTYINQYNATPVTTQQYKKPKEKEVRERIYKKPKESKDEWKRPVFKATVFGESDETGNKINEIRISLNKIKEDNCDTMTELIILKIDEIRDSIDFGDDCEMTDKMKQVFDTIYKICTSNKMFSRIYAKVLTSLCNKYASEFNELFECQLASYLTTMQNIVDVDQNIDYDAFCEFIANNNTRKNVTSLLCDIAKIGMYENFQQSNILKITEDLLNHILIIVENVEKQKEVEEISENIVIIFSHFSKELKEQFRPIFEKLALSEKKPGLSSRTKFKYMDLIGK
jgi:hypothetical protein